MAKKLWIENIENPAVVWAEAQPNADFIDKTADVLLWDKYGKQVLDLDRYRYEMKAPFYAIVGSSLQNWATTSAEIKAIGAKYFLIPYNLRLTLISDAQDKENWNLLVKLTQGYPPDNCVGRAKTFEVMRECVSDGVRTETMTMTNSQQMLKDIGQMGDWYIKSNSPDFKQWLTNEVGSPYQNAGFEQKTYYSLALKDKLYDIYNGNY